MIRNGDFIWPSKWMSKNVKLALVGILMCAWLVLGAYKYFALGSLNTTHIVAAILVYAIYCFIYDKDFPLGTVGMNYESGNDGSQFGRLIGTVVAISLYIYTVVISGY